MKVWTAYKKLLEAKDLPKNLTLVSMFKVVIHHLVTTLNIILKERGSQWPQFFSSKEREVRRRSMEKELSGQGE